MDEKQELYKKMINKFKRSQQYKEDMNATLINLLMAYEQINLIENNFKKLILVAENEVIEKEITTIINDVIKRKIKLSNQKICKSGLQDKIQNMFKKLNYDEDELHKVHVIIKLTQPSEKNMLYIANKLLGNDFFLTDTDRSVRRTDISKMNFIFIVNSKEHLNYNKANISLLHSNIDIYNLINECKEYIFKDIINIVKVYGGNLIITEEFLWMLSTYIEMTNSINEIKNYVKICTRRLLFNIELHKDTCDLSNLFYKLCHDEHNVIVCEISKKKSILKVK